LPGGDQHLPTQRSLCHPFHLFNFDGGGAETPSTRRLGVGRLSEVVGPGWLCAATREVPGKRHLVRLVEIPGDRRIYKFLYFPWSKRTTCQSCLGSPRAQFWRVSYPAKSHPVPPLYWYFRYWWYTHLCWLNTRQHALFWCFQNNFKATFTLTLSQRLKLLGFSITHISSWQSVDWDSASPNILGDILISEILWNSRPLLASYPHFSRWNRQFCWVKLYFLQKQIVFLVKTPVDNVDSNSSPVAK
jgi:hypothetical protein